MSRQKIPDGEYHIPGPVVNQIARDIAQRGDRAFKIGSRPSPCGRQPIERLRAVGCLQFAADGGLDTKCQGAAACTHATSAFRAFR